MKYLLVLSALVMAGCTSISPKSFTGPTGKTGYTMHCKDQSALTECYNKANELCPNGYTELTTSTGISLNIECK